MKKILLSVIIIVVTLIVTGRNLFSENLAKIVVNKKINLCDSNSGKFIFVVNIGMIEPIDSLFGFDIDIKYDPNKVRILSYLKSNTLSEKFEQSSFSFAADTNHIRGYATTFNFNAPPSYGDSILIGFYAEWIGDRNCEDSSLFKLEDINFTEEFKKEYQYTNEYVRTSLDIKNPINVLKTTFDVDSIGLKENQQLFSFNCKIDFFASESLKKVKITFTDTDTIKIRDIVSDCSECKISLENNVVKFILPYDKSELNMQLIAEHTLTDSLIDFAFGIDSIEVLDCNCIGKYEYDKFKIYKHILPKSINEVNLEDGILVLNIGTTYYLYDYEGKLLDKKQIVESDSKILNLNNFQGNVFFLIEQTRQNKIEYKKFYKCY